MKKVLLVLLYAAGVPFAASLLFFILLFFGAPEWLGYIIVPGLSALFYFLLRKKLDLQLSFWVHGGILLGLGLLFTLLMLVFSGSIRGVFSGIFFVATLPFGLLWFFFTLTDRQPVLCIIIFLTYLAAFLAAVFFGKNAGRKKRILAAVVSAAVLLFAGVCTALYMNRPEIRYAGHGFQYMHGFSSTDFSDYMVYSDPSKLVEPSEAPPFTIEDPQEMPVLDGAEACYPVYAAFAKAVYQDIDQIERECADADGTEFRRFNGKIVTFTNTVQGFLRMIYDYGDEVKYGSRVDIFLGARPSKSQMEIAANEGIELEITPIGREAFVFFHLRRSGILVSQNVSGKFNHAHLHAEADAKEGNLPFPCVLDGKNFPFQTALSEAGRYEDAGHPFKPRRYVLCVYIVTQHSVNTHFASICDAGVDKGLLYRFIGVLKGDIFPDKRDVDGLRRALEPVHKCAQTAKVRLREILDSQLVDYKFV